MQPITYDDLYGLLLSEELQLQADTSSLSLSITLEENYMSHSFNPSYYKGGCNSRGDRGRGRGNFLANYGWGNFVADNGLFVADHNTQDFHNSPHQCSSNSSSMIDYFL